MFLQFKFDNSVTGADLSAAPPEVGGPWSATGSTGAALITTAGHKVRGTGTTSYAIYRTGKQPASSNYFTEADMLFASAGASGTNGGPWVRINPVTSDCSGYHMYVIHSGSVALCKRTNGSNDATLATASQAITVGTPLRLRIAAVTNVDGSGNPVSVTLTGYVNGTQVLTYTDSTSPFFGVGYPGIDLYTGSDTVDDTHNLQIDNISAEYLGSSPLGVLPNPSNNTTAFRDSISPFFQMLLSERGAVFLVGNSNAIHNGDGWDEGFHYAFAQTFGLYGGGFISANENQGNGAGAGSYYNGSGTDAAYSGAPAELADYLNPGTGGLFPANYGYYSGSGNHSAQTLGRLYIQTNSGSDGDANSPFDCCDGFEVTWHTGTFPTGSGSFYPTITPLAWSGFNSFPAYNNYAEGGLISTNTGAYGMTQITVTLPPLSSDNRRAFGQWYAQLSSNAHPNIVAPAFLTWMQFVQPARTRGASVFTLDFRGGQPLRVIASDLLAASDNTLSYVFAQTRAKQGANKPMLFIVQEAQNSRTDTTLSVGPVKAPSNTAIGYADNCQAIINRIKYIYSLNKWPTDYLYFWLIADHALSNPDDVTDIMFRNTAATVVCQNNVNCSSLDFSQIVNGTEMQANGYYYGTETPHLSLAGYRNLALKAVSLYSPTGAGNPVYSQYVFPTNPPTPSVNVGLYRVKARFSVVDRAKATFVGLQSLAGASLTDSDLAGHLASGYIELKP